MNMLVTASTFPSSIDDSSPRFVYDLCKTLSERKKINPVVLVPHVLGSSLNEEMNGLKVYRYRYFFEKYELISGNGIVTKIKHNKLLTLLIPFLVVCQMIETLLLIKKYKIEIIMANWLIPQGLVAVLIKILFIKNIKIVVISHGGDATLLNNNIFFKKMGSWILGNIDVVVAVSTFIKKQLRKLNKNSGNIPVISMGVNTKVFEEAIYASEKEKEYELIFIGRLEPKKGVYYLIKALNYLKNNLNIKAVIIGDGSERIKLQNLVNKYNLKNNIIFTGALNHTKIKRYIIKSKFFVAPSIDLSDDTEGMPTVLLEAMSAGLPIITTDAGGICDVIKNNYNGLIINQHNAKDLSEKISFLLQNPSIANKLKVNGVNSVQDFSYENIAKEYEQVVGSVV